MLYNETSTYYDFFDGLYISEITEYITSFQVAVSVFSALLNFLNWIYVINLTLH